MFWPGLPAAGRSVGLTLVQAGVGLTNLGDGEVAVRSVTALNPNPAVLEHQGRTVHWFLFSEVYSYQDDKVYNVY